MRSFLSIPFYTIGYLFLMIGVAFGAIAERIECPSGSIPADNFLDR